MSVALRETNLDLPGQVGEPYIGKVRDVYTIEHHVGELVAMVSTDRISAYDHVLYETIPNKGQVLNQMSAALLGATTEVAPNWFLDSPDPNVSIGYKAARFDIEMIVRGYLLGSSWAGYQDGMRDLCGNRLPDGMREFEPFSVPLLTPTTKAAAGHDENITPGEIVDNGLATPLELEEIAFMAMDMFAAGERQAKAKGLLLADTKYEFGRLTSGQIVVIDEIHTPDSSRYFPRTEYAAYLSGEMTDQPEQLSKEFVRKWLKAHGFEGQDGQVMPHLPPDMVGQVSERYTDLYERMLGMPFESAPGDSEAEVAERIRENIVASLGNLSIQQG